MRYQPDTAVLLLAPTASHRRCGQPGFAFDLTALMESFTGVTKSMEPAEQSSCDRVSDMN